MLDHDHVSIWQDKIEKAFCLNNFKFVIKIWYRTSQQLQRREAVCQKEDLFHTFATHFAGTVISNAVIKLRYSGN